MSTIIVETRGAKGLTAAEQAFLAGQIAEPTQAALDVFLRAPAVDAAQQADADIAESLTELGEAAAVKFGEVDQLIADFKGIVLAGPAAAGFKSGALSPTSFGINFDVVTTLPVTVTLSLTDGGEAIRTLGPAAPTLNVGVGAAGDVPIYSFAGSFTGLQPNTIYYGVITQGIRGPVRFTVRTMPVQGVAASFRFAFGSCNYVWNQQRPDHIWSAIATDQPLFLNHQGDFGYPDFSVADIRVNRSYGPRYTLQNPDLLAMLRSVPLVYMFDDHDSAGNDNQWDTVYKSGATNAQIIANSRAVYDEMFPHYPQADSRVLSQTWDVGRVRFIMPDLRSQRRYEVGTPTFLGDGTNPPGSFDGVGWLRDRLAQASSDTSVALVVLSITTTWSGVQFDSYPKFAPAEQRAICEMIRDCSKPVLLLTGDDHQGGFDDGANSDYTVDGSAKFAQINCSGLSMPDTFKLAGPYTVNGVVREVEDNSNIYGLIDVADTGSGPVAWSAKIKGNPIVDGQATVLDTFTSTDTATNTVGLPAVPLLVSSRTLRARVGKTGFGPYGGCSVQWSIAETGQSGTVQFGPNRGAAFVEVTIPAGVSPITLTLSNPTSCAIGKSSIPISVYDGISDETALYLSQFQTPPNAARAALIDALFVGLKTDDVWNSLQRLHIIGATAEATLINARVPGDARVVAGAGVTWTADRKVVGNGTSTGVLDTLRTATDLSRDDHSMFVWAIDSLANANGSIGADSMYINPQFGTGTMRTRAGTGLTSTSSATPAPVGLVAVDRSLRASYDTFHNGTKRDTLAVASEAQIGSTNIFMLGWNSTAPQYSTRGIAVGGWGKSLGATKQAALYARLRTYLVAIGATT